MSFTVDLRKFAKKYGKKADLVIKKLVFDIGKSVVLRTPVGDPAYWENKPPPGYAGGRARANWQHGMSLKTAELDKTDQLGGATLMQLSQSIPSDAAGKIHYLSNNVPYIHRLESGTWSKQAPQGMVAVTVTEFDEYVKNAVRSET